MDKKKQSEEIVRIIKDYKSSSNKELEKAMDFIKEDFNFTKDLVIKFTKHLDKLEISYNTLYKEHQTRVNKK